MDVSSSNSAPETSGPSITKIIDYTNQVYSPGICRLRFTAKDDSGIEYVCFQGNVVGYPKKRVSLPAGEHEFDLVMPVSDTWNYKNYNFNILLEDKYGNYSVYSGSVFDKDKYYTECVKEFDIEFTGALSNTNVPSQLNYMDEGKTVELIIDSKSNGILKKECLDAIKGKDKTIVVKVEESGAMQWVLYGKDITNDTKDIDLTTSFEAVEGSDYGTEGKLLMIHFADNGQLPGVVNFRIKSNYIQSMYDLNSENMYLYSVNGNSVALESSNCYVIANGDYAWCYFDMTHNSSYILSSTAIHSKIVRASISKATVTNIVKKTYTGDALTQKPVVKLNGKTLKSGTDYKLSYKNNKKVGKATMTITGTGKYTGALNKTFSIVPKPTTMTSLAAAKRGFTAKWRKMTTQTTGYQLQYSTSSSFKSGNKAVYITKNTILSKKITKLKAKKKYCVRVRTYKIVSGTKYFSVWSKPKYVITK